MSQQQPNRSARPNLSLLHTASHLLRSNIWRGPGVARLISLTFLVHTSCKCWLYPHTDAEPLAATGRCHSVPVPSHRAPAAASGSPRAPLGSRRSCKHLPQDLCTGGHLLGAQSPTWLSPTFPQILWYHPGLPWPHPLQTPPTTSALPPRPLSHLRHMFVVFARLCLFH